MASLVPLDTRAVDIGLIKWVDYSRLSEEIVLVYLRGETEPCTASGFLALELVWRTSPAILEGAVNGVYKKYAWAFHNLVAHPLMQLLAFISLGRVGVRLHDATVPRPAFEKWKAKQESK